MSPRRRIRPPGAIGSGAVVGVVGIGLAVAFVLLGLVVRSGPTDVDTKVVAIIQSIATGWVRIVLDAFSVAGIPIIWDVAVVAVALGLAVRGRKADAVALVGWLLVAEVAAELAKIAFDRVRPGGVAVSDIITQASYPSGHVVRTTVALGLVAILGTASARARLLAFGMVVAVSVLMGAARVASGEHWPTDVVGGFLLSGVVVCVAALARSWSAPHRQLGQHAAN